MRGGGGGVGVWNVIACVREIGVSGVFDAW